MREKIVNFLSLFTSTGTLFCCALPAALAALAGGAAVGAYVSLFPWVIPLSRHKEWLFLGAGILIGINGIFTFRPKSKLACAITGGKGCNEASKFQRLMFWISTGIFALGLFMAYAAVAFAHQPVMDMAPRWDGGYGFQVRTETVEEEHVETKTWFEAVYTVTKEFRTTLKVPFRGGVGDVILGFPLKSYFNKQGRTGNYSLTPSFYLPTGSTSGPNPLGRGTVDYGLSLSYSAEVFRYYTLFDVFTRINTRGDDGQIKDNLLGLDWDIGIHPIHSNKHNSGVFLMTGLNARVTETEELYEVAPTTVLYWNNWMWRTQYHIPVYQDRKRGQADKKYEFQTGLGVTF